MNLQCEARKYLGYASCCQEVSQIKAEEYKEAFSSAVEYNAVNISQALDAQPNLKIHQVVVNAAFLDGRLKLSLYLTIPEGLQTGKE